VGALRKPFIIPSVNAIGAVRVVSRMRSKLWEFARAKERDDELLVWARAKERDDELLVWDWKVS